MWHTKRSETFPNARAYSHQIKAIDLESAQRRGRPLAKQLRLAAAALTDVGRRRERNQDNVTEYIPPEQDELNQKGALFVVCDGMGPCRRRDRLGDWRQHDSRCLLLKS